MMSASALSILAAILVAAGGLGYLIRVLCHRP
jgi:hypothetical protein